MINHEFCYIKRNKTWIISNSKKLTLVVKIQTINYPNNNLVWLQVWFMSLVENILFWIGEYAPLNSKNVDQLYIIHTYIT